MRIMCLTQSTWKVRSNKMAKLKHCQDDAVLSSAYPVHRLASEVNHSGADMQVVSCHHYLVVFHCFVEHLSIFHTSGFVFSESSTSIAPKRYINYA